MIFLQSTKLAILVVVIKCVLSEPPVNSYLPPGNGNGGGSKLTATSISTSFTSVQPRKRDQIFSFCLFKTAVQVQPMAPLASSLAHH